jgi:hypothetical protein
MMNRIALLLLLLVTALSLSILVTCTGGDDDSGDDDASADDAAGDDDASEWTCRSVYDVVWNCCWWMMNRCGAGGQLIVEDTQVAYCEQNQTVRGWDFGLNGPMAQCVAEAAGSCDYLKGCIGNHTPAYQCDDPNCTGSVCYDCFYDCHSDVGC